MARLSFHTVLLGGGHLIVCVASSVLLLTGCAPRTNDEEMPRRLAFDEAFRVQDSVILRAARDDPVGHVSDLGVWRGKIVIADEFQNNVKIFRFDGAHLTTIGQRGDGPGEFRSVASIAVGSDEALLVIDPASGRLSTFDSGGAFVSHQRLPGFAHNKVRRIGATDRLLIPFTLRSAEQYAVDALYVVSLAGVIVDTVAKATHPTHRFEGSVNWLTGEALGDSIVVWVPMKSNVVSFTNLGDGSTESVTVGHGVYRPPKWPDEHLSQADVFGWVRSQMWITGIIATPDRVFVRISTGGPGKHGFNEHYYAVLNDQRTQVAVVGPTDILLHAGNDDQVFGSLVDENGDVHVYRLAVMEPSPG